MGMLIVLLIFLTTFILMVGVFDLMRSKERPVERLQDYMATGSEPQYAIEERKVRFNLLRSIGDQLSKIKLLKALTRSTTTI